MTKVAAIAKTFKNLLLQKAYDFETWMTMDDHDPNMARSTKIVANTFEWGKLVKM